MTTKLDLSKKEGFAVTMPSGESYFVEYPTFEECQVLEELGRKIQEGEEEAQEPFEATLQILEKKNVPREEVLSLQIPQMKRFLEAFQAMGEDKKK
jgi:hypothetical protein